MFAPTKEEKTKTTQNPNQRGKQHPCREAYAVVTARFDISAKPTMISRQSNPRKPTDEEATRLLAMQECRMRYNRAPPPNPWVG